MLWHVNLAYFSLGWIHIFCVVFSVLAHLVMATLMHVSVTNNYCKISHETISLSWKSGIPNWTKTDWKLILGYKAHAYSFVCRYPYSDDVKAYSIFGATVCEVEVDLLTGQYQVSPVSKFTAVLACVSFNIVMLQV